MKTGNKQLKKEENWNHDPAAHSNTNQFSDTALHNDTLITFDYLQGHISHARTPEQELLLCILEQAFQDYLTLLPKKSILTDKFNEIHNWFFKDLNNNHIGSFDYLCTIFNIDKSYIRKSLIEMPMQKPTIGLRT